MAWGALASGPMSAPALIAPGPSRRRAGTLLVTYGVLGILLMGVLFVATLSVAIMGRDGFTRIDQTVDEVVGVIDSTSAGMEPGYSRFHLGTTQAWSTFRNEDGKHWIDR